MRKKVTVTIVMQRHGSAAWHGDISEGPYQIIVGMIERLLNMDPDPNETETVCFSIVVENTGARVLVTSAENLVSGAKEEMKRLGLQGEVPC